ncbi:MAG TPA: tripartite tricarboxylate transporter substrate-binding protein [Xanthobacteraceae bacterium]
MKIAACFATAALAAFAFTIAPASAEYPERPVRVVLPFAAGGIADITSRIVTERLGDKLGQRFVIDNQPGAGGISAARSALSAPRDGYVLAWLTSGTPISVSLFKTLPFDPLNDFVPIGGVGEFDGIIATGRDSDLKTFPDFLKAAREQPGKLNGGTIAIGGTQHLTSELLKTSADIDYQAVIFRTTPELIVSVLRKDVHTMIDYYAAMKSGLQDGSLRPLATTGDTRTPYLPDVPTVAESGVPGYEVTSWNSLYAPAGTPPEVIAKLAAALRETLQSPDVKQRLLDLGIVAKPLTGEEQTARMKSEIEKWRKVIERANIPKQ